MHVLSINVRAIRQKKNNNNKEVLVLVLRLPKGSKEKRKLNDVINQMSSRTTDELYHLLSIYCTHLAIYIVSNFNLILIISSPLFVDHTFCMTIYKISLSGSMPLYC